MAETNAPGRDGGFEVFKDKIETERAKVEHFNYASVVGALLLDNSAWGGPDLKGRWGDNSLIR